MRWMLVFVALFFVMVGFSVFLVSQEWYCLASFIAGSSLLPLCGARIQSNRIYQKETEQKIEPPLKTEKRVPDSWI